MTLYNKLGFQGRVESLLTRHSRDAGFVKAETGTIHLTLDGPEGDCHTGATRLSDSRTVALYPRNLAIRNVRQITILSVEELDDVARALAVPKIEPAWFGANMVLSGVPDLTLLPPSTRLQFPSGATLVVDLENYPCSQIAAAVGEHYPDVKKLVVKQAMHKRGVTAWVEREGDVATGDAVTLFIPPQRIYAYS
jgi:MOSC domain